MERSGHIVEILDLGDARIFEPYRVKREKTWEAIGVRSISARCIAATDVALPCAQRLASEAPEARWSGGHALVTIAPYACSSVTGTPARTVLCISATASVTRKSSAILSGAAEDDTLAR